MVELLQQYRVLFESMSQGAFYQRADGTLKEANNAALEMTGLDREQLADWLSDRNTNLFIRKDRTQLPREEFPSLVAMRSARPIHGFEAGIFNRVKNRLVWLSISALPLFPKGAVSPSLVLVTLEDISELKCSGEIHPSCQIFTDFAKADSPKDFLVKTLESERYYRTIVENQTEFVERFLPGGILTYVNKSLCDYVGLGPDELLGQSFYPFVHEEDRDYVINCIASLSPERPVVTTDHRVVLAGGRVRWHQWTQYAIFDSSGAFMEYQAVGRDITDEKRAEEERLGFEKQLLQGQKLESLGLLAGGIAHDFNNILTGILGSTSLALHYTAPDSPMAAYLLMIEKAASRAADLTRQMLAFSGKGRFQMETIDLNQLLQDMHPLLGTSVLKKAQLRLDLAPGLPAVEADASQLRQVIMNITVNAAEAIGERGGDIMVRTYVKECGVPDAGKTYLAENVSDGCYVVLEIADTGCGMDNQTMARIFDPFYSTRFTGRGLGLSAVLGIVKGQKGAIQVASTPGLGATFSVLLPASNRPLPVPLRKAPETWTGSGVVLLVDDEETVRSVGSEMLRLLGFRVLTAGSGEQAVEIYRTRTTAIGFVLLDLTMPHMDGEQTFRELLRIDPDARVIISSGFSEIDVTERFAGTQLVGFVQKPYRLSELQDALMRMLP